MKPWVSSPQGNATNWNTVCRSPETPGSCFKSPRECYKRTVKLPKEIAMKLFQVPKGMLQTEYQNYRQNEQSQVSSPQGNATNKVVSKTEDGDEVGFKSPRECYKLHGDFQTLLRWTCFKSPRECYKLISSSSSESCFCCFKSPRECYKRLGNHLNHLFRGVSSPQGNATNDGLWLILSFGDFRVSSPQGNATNGGHGNLAVAETAVSSPQGNATNTP